MTHQIIYFIVYADDKKEARDKAGELLRHIVGEGTGFDYGTFFDEDSSVSGKSRWGNISAVVSVDSKEGKQMIKGGMKATKEGFIEKIKKVKEMINFYSDEELFEGEVIDIRNKILENLKENKKLYIRSFRYYCDCLGQYIGTEIWIYDNDGEGIRNNQDLKDVLNKWNMGKKVWIVPCDVHS